jgi:hypothetical protein
VWFAAIVINIRSSWWVLTEGELKAEITDMSEAERLHRYLVGQPDSRRSLNTPALVIDLEMLDRNIAAMAAFARQHDIKLRPHSKTVIGTVSTEAKAELARAQGCSHTILYTKRDFVVEVARISDGEKLPVVLDSVGKDTCLRSLDCLRPRGLMVTFGQASGPIDPIAPVVLSQKGLLFLTRPFLFHYIEQREALETCANDLFDVVASGKVRINVNQRFALKDAADAHRALEARATSGSTILTI